MTDQDRYARNLERLIQVFAGRDVLTLKEVAGYMHTDRDVLLRDQHTPFQKIGGKWLTTVMALAEWLP